MYAITKRFSFPGGIHPPQYKQLSTEQGIRSLALPPRLYLPLRQHSGEAAVPVVNTGDYVYKGQLLAKAIATISAPVHAPSSGVLREISPHPVPHPSGLESPCMVLELDGLDKISEPPLAQGNVVISDRWELIKRIEDAGIVGLGGAAFPSATKIKTPKDVLIDTLLINGAECEPYISCDDMLMRTQRQKIWQGIHILCRILEPRQCILAIEDNKPEAIASMRQGLQLFSAGFPCSVQLRVVATRYPTGGEKQLIKIVTGREVPSGKLPLHIGVVCQNVATTKAIAEAVHANTPLTSRLITVTGDGIRRPGNYHVLLGTPIEHIIRECGGLSVDDASLTMGGPMMGIRLQSQAIPVVKGMNCLLVRKPVRATKPTMACIRCGRCAHACPMSLLPQQLYRYTQAHDFEKSQNLSLMDCIECGCCEYVCPSGIPLVQYYRFAKAEIRMQHQDKLKSDIARQRHEQRQQRIASEQAQRREKQRKARPSPQSSLNTADQTVRQ